MSAFLKEAEVPLKKPSNFRSGAKSLVGTTHNLQYLLSYMHRYRNRYHIVFIDFQTKCPFGKKTKLYKKAKLEKFADYLLKDGLSSRLSITSDYECKIRNSAASGTRFQNFITEGFSFFLLQ